MQNPLTLNHTPPPKSQVPATNLASTPSMYPQTTYALMADTNFAPATVYDTHMNPLEEYLSHVEAPMSVFTITTENEEVLMYANSGVTDHCFVR